MADAEPRPRALVTGGARGIGRAAAEALATAGWHVVAADRDEVDTGGADDCPAIATAILDICDRDAVRRLVEAEGPFDVLVNNAAITAPMLPFAAITPDAFERAMRVNVHGQFIVAQEVARRMEGGAIVNISSRGYLGGAAAADYVLSKSAVVGMTRSMAVELRWRGISVNAIAPGMIETRMLDGYTPEMREKVRDMDPVGAMDPAVIAGAVAYFASPAGRFVTGQVLLVDAGKAIGVEAY